MPKTQIFETYDQFQNRKDKSVNGVSPEFARAYPNWRQMNETNAGCWNCVNCKGCSDCINCDRCNDCVNCYGCGWCTDCDNCTDCNHCANCDYCINCDDCSDCEDCNNCYICLANKNISFLIRGEKFTPPKIPNIHQKVYAAASQENALDMAEWHTCETTHCRAGWVVALAGKEGKELELKIDTDFAAMVTYRASSDIRVSPAMFYVSNEEALKDMKRCADLEKAGVICNE